MEPIHNPSAVRAQAPALSNGQAQAKNVVNHIREADSPRAVGGINNFKVWSPRKYLTIRKSSNFPISLISLHVML